MNRQQKTTDNPRVPLPFVPQRPVSDVTLVQHVRDKNDPHDTLKRAKQVRIFSSYPSGSDLDALNDGDLVIVYSTGVQYRASVKDVDGSRVVSLIELLTSAATKADVDAKADKATTLAGYGITDAATKADMAIKADLVDGKVPAAQLPSYVDDVLEYDTMSAFPASGESSKIYVAKDTNLVYRWSGTQYVEISPSPALDDTVTESSPNGVKSSGIWSWVKSLLPQWLTGDYAEPATVASVANKRDKTDLAVHDFTEWSGVPTGYYIKFDEEFKWAMRSSETDATVGATVGRETDLRVMFGADDWSGGYEFTATRSTVPTSDTLAKKSELTAGLAAKRSNTDLAVYEFTGWTFAPALPDSYEIRYRDDLGGWGVYYNGSIAGTVKGSYDSLEISWDGNEWGGGYPFTATRSRIQTADTLATTNGVNAAIEAHHDDTKRDLADNTCHKTEFGEWVANIDIPNDVNTQPEYSEADRVWFWYRKSGRDLEDLFAVSDAVTDDKDDELTFYKTEGGTPIVGGAFTATRSAVCTDGKKFVTSDVVDGKVSSAVSTNNPAFVSAVQNTPAPEPGQGEDPPWGTWGTVGAAITGLVAGLKWLKDKVFDSAGNIQDQFATDLLGKSVANVKANTASLAAAYSASATYAVGDAVTYEGKLYKCAVAITTAETWTPAHWTEATVATLWNNADTTSYGGQN